MNVPQESRSTLMSRPDLRTLDGHGTTVLVAGRRSGRRCARNREACRPAWARRCCSASARPRRSLRRVSRSARTSGTRARRDAGRSGRDRQIEPLLFERDRAGTLDASARRLGRAVPRRRVARCTARSCCRPSGAYRFRGALLRSQRRRRRCNFLGSELAGTIAVARELTRFWKRVGAARRGAARGLRVERRRRRRQRLRRHPARRDRGADPRLARRERAARRRLGDRAQPSSGRTRSCAGAAPTPSRCRSRPVRRRACCS
jgi:hypothetical protein